MFCYHDLASCRLHWQHCCPIHVCATKAALRCAAHVPTAHRTSTLYCTEALGPLNQYTQWLPCAEGLRVGAHGCVLQARRLNKRVAISSLTFQNVAASGQTARECKPNMINNDLTNDHATHNSNSPQKPKHAHITNRSQTQPAEQADGRCAVPKKQRLAVC